MVIVLPTVLVQGSSREVSLYIRIRSIGNNQHQLQPSDNQAGPQWLVRAEVKPESQSIAGTSINMSKHKQGCGSTCSRLSSSLALVGSGGPGQSLYELHDLWAGAVEWSPQVELLRVIMGY